MYKGPKSHERGGEAPEMRGHGEPVTSAFAEGDYPETYLDHAGHPYGAHSDHEMEAPGHMTKEVAHGVEYDSYHYLDRKDKKI